MKYNANGVAIKKDSKTNRKKSIDNNVTMPDTEAPSTFLIPISLTLLTAANVDRPKRPRQARKIDIPPAHPTILLQRTSLS